LKAVYDLSRSPPTWDFSAWLLNAERSRRREGDKSLEVSFIPGPVAGFRDDDLPPSPEDRKFFLNNVARPLLPLIGATEVDAGDGSGWRGRYQLAVLAEDHIDGEEVPQFHPSDAAQMRVRSWLTKPYITITLRNCGYWPTRNSRLDVWRQVARQLAGYEIIWVPDTADAGQFQSDLGIVSSWASVNVDLRGALYAGAALNLGVNNGPMMMLYFGSAPYLVVKQLVENAPCVSVRSWRQATGIPVGGQFPWAKENQRLGWIDDDNPDKILDLIGAIL